MRERKTDSTNALDPLNLIVRLHPLNLTRPHALYVNFLCLVQDLFPVFSVLMQEQAGSEYTTD